MHFFDFTERGPSHVGSLDLGYSNEHQIVPEPGGIRKLAVLECIDPNQNSARLTREKQMTAGPLYLAFLIAKLMLPTTTG